MLVIENDIRPVLAKIQKERGIDFHLYRDSTLRRRIDRRLTMHKCTDVISYLTILESDPFEYDLLLRDLTIKYTEFFRDPWVFDLIRSKIMPDLIARKRNTLNIWSAACATGEEAFSLSILVKQMSLHEQIPKVNILGTDIDPSAIATAHCGTYVKTLMPSPLDNNIITYFYDNGKNLTVLPEIKESVKFNVHDLTAPSAASKLREIQAGNFDLILCRNFLMYLQRSTQANVLELCCSFLNPGGYLIIGTSETVPQNMEKSLVQIDKKAKIYSKVYEENQDNVS